MTFSCDSALAEVQSEYESLPIETRAGKTVQLRNLLMLGEEGLKTAMVLVKSLDSEDSDPTALMPKLRDLLLLVADNPTALKAEMKDWPLGMYMKVSDAWQETTELGEASDSDS